MAKNDDIFGGPDDGRPLPPLGGKGGKHRDRSPDDPRQFMITANTLEHPIIGWLGESQPVPAGGVGGWDIVSRPDDTGLPTWNGSAPWTLQLDVLFDRWVERGSVQALVNRLIKVASQRKDGKPPTRIKVWGRAIPKHLNGEQFVISDITWGDSLRSNSGVLRSQAATLSLIEYESADKIKIKRVKRKKHKGGKGTKKYTVKKGDTLQKIAAKFYGDSRKWKVIAKRNDIKNPRKLKVGMVLKIPHA